MEETILVVDDEPKVLRLARDYLEKNGFRVITAADGAMALSAARREHPDLIILDVMLPGVDGRDVIRTLRHESDVPIIMLTALSEESDQIVGLELGADDYITKPFSPRALVARVRAVLRRVHGQVLEPEILRTGALEIDILHHTVLYQGQPVHLTPSEFKLLAALVRHSGQALTRQSLLDELYGNSPAGFDRSIDSHIKNIRRKIETDPGGTPRIETVYGVGYRLVD